MLHVGELTKILAFLGDQREKLVASDALFAGVLKKDGDETTNGAGGGGGTLYLSHPVYPCTSFDEEKKQLAARRERARRLKERRAKLEAEGGGGGVNRTDDEIEAMMEAEMLAAEGERGAAAAAGGGKSNNSQILGGNNDSKNPTMKVITFAEMKKPDASSSAQKPAGSGAVGVRGTSTGSGGSGFVKEKPALAAAGGAGGAKAASGLAGLKSNNVAIKIFSNEGTSSVPSRVRLLVVSLRMYGSCACVRCACRPAGATSAEQGLTSWWWVCNGGQDHRWSCACPTRPRWGKWWRST
jgi:hypothetical protein